MAFAAAYFRRVYETSRRFNEEDEKWMMVFGLKELLNVTEDRIVSENRASGTDCC